VEPAGSGWQAGHAVGALDRPARRANGRGTLGLARRGTEPRATPKRVRRSLSGFVTGERIPEPRDPTAALVYDVLIQADQGWTTPQLEAEGEQTRDALAWLLYIKALGAEELQSLEDDSQPPKNAHEEQQRRSARKALAKRTRELIYPPDEPEEPADG
jgi:hypothetical protein